MPTLARDGLRRFIFTCKFDERHLARDNGFLWDRTAHVWYTSDVAVAARLRTYASADVKSKLDGLFLSVTPWTAPLPQPPSPDLALMPHQETALRFALERNRSYLALDPGLGKTIVAAMLARVYAPRGGAVVYVTPPFLQQNVEAEFERWGAGKLVHIVRDSMLTRGETKDYVSRLVRTKRADTLIVDEAHRFKNPEANRTRALFKEIAPLFPRQVFLSGTPMPNRPIELYPVLSSAAGETIDFMKYFEFGRRYCAGYRGSHGWDFTGASNVEELAERIKPFMLRMKKDLLDLPPKIEEVFVLDSKMSGSLSKLEKEISPEIEKALKSELALSIGKTGDSLHLGTYRRLLGIEKVKASAEYIRDVVETTGENVIVFAYHKEVVAGLEAALKDFEPIVITGDTPTNARQALVGKFQSDAGSKIIIGNYDAMGVGFTLTRATRVFFVEYSWVPGNNDQSSDRAHRIGQEKTVFVQYLVYGNSIDEKVIRTILRKRKAIAHI